MKINFERGLVLFLSIVLFSVIFVGFVLGDASVQVNIETDGDIITETNINNTGDTQVWINGVEWSDLPDYIKENEGSWSRDRGWEAREIDELLDKLQRFMNGEEVDITEDEYNILLHLLWISDNEINSFYQNELTPILDSHKNQIQSNIYDIEAFYRTMEKLHPEIYCESKKEVMNKYFLKSVKCGLNSKYCYNGKYYAQQESGFDYCIYSDDMGMSEDGMDIHVRSIEIPDSEEKSLTPLVIEFYNQGEKTLKPVVKVKIMKLEDVLDTFDQEINEIPLKENKKVVLAWNNSKIEPGRYMARITIGLGKKEILDDVYFDVLKEGTLETDGKIMSIDAGKALTYEDLQINVMVKNNLDIARDYKLSGEVYKNGKKIEDITSMEKVIGAGDTIAVPIIYRVGGLGEYRIDVTLNGQKESYTFSPEPTTPTGKFITSPSPVKAGVIGFIAIVLVALYRVKFYKKANKRKRIKTFSKRERIAKKKVNFSFDPHFLIAFLFLVGFYLIL